MKQANVLTAVGIFMCCLTACLADSQGRNYHAQRPAPQGRQGYGGIEFPPDCHEHGCTPGMACFKEVRSRRGNTCHPLPRGIATTAVSLECLLNGCPYPDQCILVAPFAGGYCFREEDCRDLRCGPDEQCVEPGNGEAARCEAKPHYCKDVNCEEDEVCKWRDEEFMCSPCPPDTVLWCSCPSSVSAACVKRTPDCTPTEFYGQPCEFGRAVDRDGCPARYQCNPDPVNPSCETTDCSDGSFCEMSAATNCPEGEQCAQVPVCYPFIHYCMNISCTQGMQCAWVNAGECNCSPNDPSCQCPLSGPQCVRNYAFDCGEPCDAPCDFGYAKRLDGCPSCECAPAWSGAYTCENLRCGEGEECTMKPTKCAPSSAPCPNFPSCEKTTPTAPPCPPVWQCKCRANQESYDYTDSNGCRRCDCREVSRDPASCPPARCMCGPTQHRQLYTDQQSNCEHCVCINRPPSHSDQNAQCFNMNGATGPRPVLFSVPSDGCPRGSAVQTSTVDTQVCCPTSPTYSEKPDCPEGAAPTSIQLSEAVTQCDMPCGAQQQCTVHANGRWAACCPINARDPCEGRCTADQICRPMTSLSCTLHNNCIYRCAYRN